MATQEKALELRKLRESLGVTQATLAEALGVTQAYVSSLEKGLRKNSDLLQKAVEFLNGVVAPGRNPDANTVLRTASLKYSPRTTVHSNSAGVLNWAWSSFSKLRDTSDIYDHAAIDSKTFSLIVADIVGSGIRGSWQAAQIRFGFHALASTLTRHNNHPAAYIGPLGNALNNAKTRHSAPPSIALACLDCSTGSVNYSAFGLPAPISYQKKKDQTNRQAVQAADLITFGLSSISSTTVALEEGDCLILCTDGFYDWLKQSKHLSAATISTLFAEAAKNFSGNSNGIVSSIVSAKSQSIDSTFTDDATIVVITRDKRGRLG